VSVGNRLDFGDGNYILMGGGCIADPAYRQMMSPGRWEAEQAALERERLQAEEEAAQKAAEGSEAAFVARHRGEQFHTVGEFLMQKAAEDDRADRRAQAGLHSRECGCSLCNNKYSGGAVDDRPRRLPSIVAAENKAKAEAILSQPASKGDVGRVKQALGWLEAKVDRVDRKTRSNAEAVQARHAAFMAHLAELSPDDDDSDVRTRYRSREPGVYY
jgi:hypothetical protein